VLVNYRDSAISEGKAGQVKGGDRLPWVRLEAGDNFDSFRTIGWQVHVYGALSAALREWCGRSALPLYSFAWRKAFESAGLLENAMYLVRPDTYVALAAEQQNPDLLERYFAKHRLSPAPGARPQV
jgi:hypothetical protein